MKKRLFSPRQKKILKMISGNLCQICGNKLNGKFHADHIVPYSKGGRTILKNAQALCENCNLRRKFLKLKLRDWQEKAKLKCLNWYSNSDDNRFVINAAPGTGKTYGAIAIADDLFHKGLIERVIVIAPQDTVVDKWAEDYLAVTGRYMQRTTNLDDGDHGTDFCNTWMMVNKLLDGYQKVCNEKKTLVICDEQHHAAATAVWGNSAINAFKNAKFILMLTGTPIRSDSEEPAFLQYEGGELKHPKDGQYTLTYGEAVKLGYCRPIAFHRHEANFDILDAEGGPKLGSVSEKNNC